MPQINDISYLKPLSRYNLPQDVNNGNIECFISKEIFALKGGQMIDHLQSFITDHGGHAALAKAKV